VRDLPRPYQGVSQITQWLKGVSSDTITDKMIREYIDERQGEQVADDSRFPIDNPRTPRLTAEGCSVVCCANQTA